MADNLLSVERLRVILPGLARIQFPEPRHIDWSAIHEHLGTHLPSDFIALTENYGSIVIGDLAYIFTPTSEDCDSYLSEVNTQSEIVQDWADSDMSRGFEPYPQEGGLLPWGDTNQGDMFFWETKSRDPEQWPVVIATRSDAWSTFEGGMADFLTEWLRGGMEMWDLPPIEPVVNAA